MKYKRAMRALLAIVCGLMLTSCLATSSDLYDLADEFRAREQGLTTDEQLAEALQAKGEEIEERAKAIAGSLPTSPMGWLSLLGTMGATAAAAGIGVNKHRNNKRIARSEPV